MKKLLLLSILLTASVSINAKPAVVFSGVSFNYFYTSLEPYGEWIELDRDVVVWRPNLVRHSWRPYNDGQWVWTVDGWYWDSFEPFGWATYHYGRWFYDDFYGWVWMPDYEWAPAWVEWRYNDNYIGWAPLPPYASFRPDFGIHFSIGWHSHHNYWNFVSYPHFCHRDVNVYIIDNSKNINIYNKTKYRTNYNYRDGRIINGGVDRNFVERRSGSKIVERRISSTSDIGEYKIRDNNNSKHVTVFRPSDRDVEKMGNVERKNIVKSERKTSLDVSKISTSSSRTEVSKNRNAEVKKNRNVNKEVKTSTRSSEIIKREKTTDGTERKVIRETSPKPREKPKSDNSKIEKSTRGSETKSYKSKTDVRSSEKMSAYNKNSAESKKIIVNKKNDTKPSNKISRTVKNKSNESKKILKSPDKPKTKSNTTVKSNSDKKPKTNRK